MEETDLDLIPSLFPGTHGADIFYRWNSPPSTGVAFTDEDDDYTSSAPSFPTLKYAQS